MKTQKIGIKSISTHIFGVTLLGLIFPLVYLLYQMWGIEQIGQGIDYFFIPSVFIFTIIGSSVVHEVIHAIAAVLFSEATIHDVRFGIIWKKIILYCHVEIPIKKNQYMIFLLAPFVVLGIVPLVSSIVLGSGYLAVFSIFGIAGAGGDIMMLWKMRAFPHTALIKDSDNEPSFEVIYN